MSAQEHIDGFVVTARKWRPQLFSEMVGQDHISTTLSNALLSGRVHHAYLFCGPRGVGKTTTARIFARALNCTNSKNGIEPCNECDSCRDILSGRSLDVIEIDGASNNSVDDVRKLRENAKYPPVHGKYKMYIIDEVHMLSTSAFNALLKTLEEPPPHLLFMFATTESHKVPATIVSRCQRFDFRRMQVDVIVKHLAYISSKENVSIDEASLVAIAKKGDGSMRDAQSIFDQVRAFCGETISYQELAGALHLIDEEFYFRISDAVISHNAAAMFELVQQIMLRGYDIHECLHGLTEHYRNILSIIATKQSSLIESSAASILRFQQATDHYKQAEVLRIMTLINNAEQQLKFSAQPRFRFELLLVQLASLDSTVEIAQLLNEIKESKKNGSKIGMLSSVVHATMPSAPQATRASSALSTSSSAKEIALNSSMMNSASPTSSTMYRPSKNVAKSPAPVVDTMEASNRWSSTTSAGSNGQKMKVELPASGIEPAVGGFIEGPLIKASVLQAGWSEFSKSLPQSLAAFKLCLNSKDICSVRFFDGEVLILNTEKFMCDDLNARRAQIVTQFEKFFGSSIRFKVLHTQSIADLPEQRSSEESANDIASLSRSQQSNGSDDESLQSTSQNSNPLEKLPIENSLVELFAAKKIPLPSV